MYDTLVSLSLTTPIRKLVCKMVSTSSAVSLVAVDDKNGGQASWGRWEQSKQEVTCILPLPAGTRGKELKVCITSTTVNAQLKGEVLVQGGLTASVVADDSYWELNEGNLEIHLVKELPAKACGRENAEGWWPCVLRTDSALDVTLCDKEPFMLGEMDDLQQNSMRSMVARMLGSDDPTDGKAPTLDPLID